MAKLFQNLKPVFIYWSAVFISFAAYFMADFDYVTPLNRNQLAQLFCYASLAVFCVLFGRFSDLKESKIGLIIIAFQLFAGGIIGIFNLPLPADIAVYTNYIMYGGGNDAPFDALFHYEYNAWGRLLNFLFSIAFPSVMIWIGYKIKQFRNK